MDDQARFGEYRAQHHLLDADNRIVYCYIAKNACSTMKFHFIRKAQGRAGGLSDSKINENLHPLAKQYAVSQIPDDRFDGHFVFAILRDPRARIVSAFLDKLVQSRKRPAYVARLMERADPGKRPGDWTFSDFLKAIAASPVDSLNEHWMPQHVHLAPAVQYELVTLEAMASDPRLAAHYQGLERNVREHSIEYARVDEPAHLTPCRAFWTMKEAGRPMPDWQAFLQPEVWDDFLAVFGADQALYEEAKAQSAGAMAAAEVPPAVLTSPVPLAPSSRLQSPDPSALISVIVPVYNVETYIDACLQSLLEQDDSNFELIIVDDGGTDSSVQRVERFLPLFKGRARLISQPNRGLGGARNTGIRLAKGEFVTFIDSDDTVSPDYISLLRQVQLDGDHDVVTGALAHVSEGGDYLKRARIVPDGVKKRFAVHERVLGAIDLAVSCGRLYRKSLIEVNQLWFPEKIPHEDLFFTYKALWLAASHGDVDKEIYFWRQREGSLGKSISKAHIDVLSQLRVDMQEFLSQFANNKRNFNLAARRLTTLQNHFRTKISEENREMRDYFLRFISKEEVHILENQKLLADAEFDADNLLAGSRKILGEMQRWREAVDATPVDIAFFPLRAYHLADCLAAARALEAKGLSVRIVETDAWRDSQGEVTRAAASQGLELTSFEACLAWRNPPALVVMWNDWDPLMRILSKACHDVGVTTVGWVEGIQDYHGVDTGERNQRCPYRRSKHLILPGLFDAGYFQDTGQVLHIGEVIRISELWQHRKPLSPKSESSHHSRTALINSNFSYGVLEEHRDEWVRQSVESAVKAGLQPVLSRHPFDKGELYPEYLTRQAFIPVVRDSDVTIQRFASGILEALAIGKPVIYFNPHGEKVDKFTDPLGAYLIAETREQLEAMLQQRLYAWKEREAQRFLQFHAGLPAAGEAPGARQVSILLDILGGSDKAQAPLASALGDLPEAGDWKALRAAANQIGPFYGMGAPTVSGPTLVRSGQSQAPDDERPPPTRIQIVSPEGLDADVIARAVAPGSPEELLRLMQSHRPRPPVPAFASQKFVYVFGDPRRIASAAFAAAMSLGSASGQMASPPPRSGDESGGRSRNAGAGPALLATPSTLSDWLEGGAGFLQLQDHFDNWFYGSQPYPVLFIRYDTLSKTSDRLFDWVGAHQKPGRLTPIFPGQGRQSAKEVEVLETVYGPFARRLESLPDIFVRSCGRTHALSLVNDEARMRVGAG